MRIGLRALIASLVVAAGMGAVQAGSYEDFFVAIKRDNGPAITALLSRGFDPNTPDAQGVHGLLLALSEPSPRAAEALIAWPKTELNARSADDETPLMMAALKGQTALAKRLIDRGAHVNKPGWAPLHYAATHGHLEIMNMLLERHAYIDAESPNKTTPLMMAAHYGTPAAVKLLLDAGADAALKNQLGLTAVDFAVKASRAESAEMIAKAIRNRQPGGRW